MLIDVLHTTEFQADARKQELNKEKDSSSAVQALEVSFLLGLTPVHLMSCFI